MVEFGMCEKGRNKESVRGPQKWLMFRAAKKPSSYHLLSHMPKVYNYVFAPIGNARVSDEMLDCGSFRVQSVRGEALRNIARLMNEHSPALRDTLPYDLEHADEVVFVIKSLQIVEDDSTYDPDSNLGTIEYIPEQYDVFRKERICFNMICREPVFLPIALCADDFPPVRSLAWFWYPDVRDWLFRFHEEQAIQKSTVRPIQKLMTFQSGEFLDRREWLTQALLEYDVGCQFRREFNDRLRDYFSTLEALYTVEKEGIAQNLATRVAMVLAGRDEEYGEVLDRVKNLYNACSSKRHGKQTSNLHEEDLVELREYVRRGILMAFELSKQVKGLGDWQKICKRLLNPRDKQLLQELESIRGGWDAIW